MEINQSVVYLIHNYRLNITFKQCINRIYIEMESFKSPKLITDHYDEVTQQVDIFVERLLEKCHDFETDLKRDEKAAADVYRDLRLYKLETSDDDILEDDQEYEDNISGYKDPYKPYYEYDMSRVCSSDVVALEPIRVRGYLELLWSKAIEELKKAEEETLESYEINRHLYKYDRESLTDEKVAEMRRNLFGEKFCFMIKINQNENIFNELLIITDFYLDDIDLRLLK